MHADLFAAVVWLVVLAVVAALVMIRPRHRPRVGPGASGSVYDLLNEDKRRAIEIIVEERAEATDPEHRDGNLPELEHPTRPRTPRT